MRLLSAVLILLLCLFSINAKAYGPPGYVPDAPHPRIFLTASKLTELQSKVTAGDADWVELKAKADAMLTYSVPAYDRYATPAGSINYSYQGYGWYEAIQVLGLAYKVTGTSAYAAKLKELIDVMNAAGNTALNVDSGYPSRYIALGMALAYDWLYDYLDAPTKSAMIVTINNWYDWYKVNAYQRSNPSGAGNYYGGHIVGFGLCGLATYGDNDRSAEINSYIRNLWDTQAVPAFTTGAFAGGYPIESFNYGEPNTQRLLSYAYSVETASGENLMSDYGTKAATSLLYNLKPNRWQSSDEGDFTGSFTGVMWKNLPMFLSSVLAGSPGDQMAYFTSDFTSTPNSTATNNIQKPYVFERFLFKSSRTAENYKLTRPLTYRSPGDEHIFTRSDWTDNAIWSSFNGGSTRYADHQALSGGHVSIQRGSDYLLVNAGQWKGASGLYGSPYNTISASAAANTLFFADGGVYARDNSALFYGGQEGYGATNILKYAVGNGYVYEKADLTGAYYASTDIHPIAARTLTYFHRNYIALNGGGLVVVYDRAKATDATYTKRLHWYLNPSGTTSTVGLLTTTDVGASRLHIKTVYPLDATATISDNPAGYATSTIYGKRLEITGTLSTEFNPLTVMLATASGEATPTISGIDTAAMQGVLVGATPHIVLFSKEGTPQSSVTYTAAYSAGVTGDHMLVDIAPAIYDVYRDGAKILEGVEASSQGVLSFSASGGSQFQLVQTGEAPAPPPDPSPAAATFRGSLRGSLR